MTTETSPKTELPTEVTPDWEPPMPPTDLIFDDGELLESKRHRIAMNSLINSLYQHWSHRNDFFAGGNMFIYYSSTQARNRDYKGPDFFVVLDVDGKTDRQGWVVWEEEGRYPDVIIELTSASTASVDIGKKKDIYEQIFRTPYYFIFHPFDPNSLQGWRLENSKYQELQRNDKGWLWCEELELWLGTWEGTILQESAVWLRFYDEQGNLVLLPGEVADQERQRAESLTAKLKELGVDPDSV
ncbi:MAG: Uma2 family endonuclease [Okeania sp. SIO2C9]|uniref:Uma2 family endonuclease n=1 Tax=Okeania sp. SIO2C9 TaxID=2607791 RepID=UPI0013C250CB|nr:Uma2 family endonuclease [Okeania sp. SIO2C9]NEQ71720.1 Uma2 family endonuclease [Okeania sp. SIO2C9]